MAYRNIKDYTFEIKCKIDLKPDSKLKGPSRGINLSYLGALFPHKSIIHGPFEVNLLVLEGIVTQWQKKGSEVFRGTRDCPM